MTTYILKAIEAVERNAAEARARLARESEFPEHDSEALTSAAAAPATIASVDAEIEEIQRFERLATAARRDYIASFGSADGGEEAAA